MILARLWPAAGSSTKGSAKVVTEGKKDSGDATDSSDASGDSNSGVKQSYVYYMYSIIIYICIHI